MEKQKDLLLILLFTALLMFSSGCHSTAEDALLPAPTGSTLIETASAEPVQQYSSNNTAITAGSLPSANGQANHVTAPADGCELETPAFATPVETPADDVFVRVEEYIPTLIIELKYASEDNFMDKVIYEFEEAWLRYGTVKKLQAVQEELQGLGYGLKIWDAFRPVSAQFKLWEAVPDARYVANPNTGYSSHSRGNAVDVTLVDLDGRDLMMPTGFDDFSTLADRNYDDVSEEAATNAGLLEILMIKHGFNAYQAEWWHYSDKTSYAVDKEYEPK